MAPDPSPTQPSPLHASKRPARDGGISTRRRVFWKPVLRPAVGRRLPDDLLPEAVYQMAASFDGGLADSRFATLLSTIDQAPFHTDTRIELYTSGKPVFAQMLDDIANARHEILLEAYIIRDDQTGEDFLHALNAAAARGVAVKVLADSFGSSETRAQFWKLLRQQGSRVRLFRRPIYTPVSLLPIIDHRKLLIIDREVGYTGGMNIADEYRHGRGGENGWRDTHVRLQGGIIWELVLIFSESWSASGGEALKSDGLYPTSTPGVRALLLDTRPGRGQDEVFSSFAATMGGSRRQLLITNPYFAPGRRVLQLLKQTAARGVDVCLLLPGKSDLPIIRTASLGYYRELLDAGIRIFEYQHAVLHAKTIVADSSVAIIGSTNFDFRSFNFNAECNVLIDDAAIATQLTDIFYDDIKLSREVTVSDWSRRPLFPRIVAWLARRVAFLM